LLSVASFFIARDPDALRYGEPWRELVSDKLVPSLAQEIQEPRKQLAAKDRMMCEHGLTKDNFMPAADARHDVHIASGMPNRLATRTRTAQSKG
jgi:hypothetical protein